MNDYIFPILGDYRVSSGFGKRKSPGGIGSTNHRGIDLAAPAGTPVVAPISGEVIFAGRAGGYGNRIVIAGADGYNHTFNHLQGFNVGSGSQVTAGAQIGAVGTSGNSTGSHLHYEVKNKAGQFINPTGILGKAKQGLIDVAKKGLAGALSTTFPSLGGAEDILTGGCGLNPFCHLQEWIEESEFFQRLAIAVLAFIIIAAAFFMMKSGLIQNVAGKIKEA